MIYFECDSNGKVGLIHYLPFDEEQGLGKTEEELLQKGLLVDSIPEPPISALPLGQRYELRYDAQTGTFSYSVVERQLTFVEKLDITKQVNEDLLSENKQLKDQQTLMQQAIDDLILGGTL
jgi:hypothetical protein